MSVRTSARYAFGLVFARFLPLNADLTLPDPDRLIGGVGPFDFDDPLITIGAVPLSIKIDNEAVETVSVNLSGAVDPAAVTATELRDAINTATPTDMAASIDVDTSRIMLAYSGSEVPVYIQVYGVCALIALFGQGLGVQFIRSDTIRTIGDTPTQKDEETISTTDAKGLDTEILTDGYRKGFTASIVDTAEDWALLALIEGGTYDPAAGTYAVPTSEDDKIYFMVEAFYAQYSSGSNKEADLVGYVMKWFKSCKGTVGEKTHERGFADGNYAITGTSYRDEDGDLHADTLLTELSVAQYAALDVYNV